MEDWTDIRRLTVEGIPNARIADRLGISRTTLIKAFKSTDPPNYHRKSKETSFTSFEPRVRDLFFEFHDMPVSVLAEHVCWSGSMSKHETLARWPDLGK